MSLLLSVASSSFGLGRALTPEQLAQRAKYSKVCQTFTNSVNQTSQNERNLIKSDGPNLAGLLLDLEKTMIKWTDEETKVEKSLPKYKIRVFVGSLPNDTNFEDLATFYQKDAKKAYRLTDEEKAANPYHRIYANRAINFELRNKPPANLHRGHSVLVKSVGATAFALDPSKAKDGDGFSGNGRMAFKFTAQSVDRLQYVTMEGMALEKLKEIFDPSSGRIPFLKEETGEVPDSKYAVLSENCVTLVVLGTTNNPAVNSAALFELKDGTVALPKYFPATEKDNWLSWDKDMMNNKEVKDGHPCIRFNLEVVQWSGELKVDENEAPHPDQVVFVSVAGYDAAVAAFQITKPTRWLNIAPAIMKHCTYVVMGNVSITETKNMELNKLKTNDHYNFALALRMQMMLPLVSTLYQTVGFPITPKAASQHFTRLANTVVDTYQNPAPANLEDLVINLDENPGLRSQILDDPRASEKWDIRLVTAFPLMQSWVTDLIPKMQPEDGDLLLRIYLDQTMQREEVMDNRFASNIVLAGVTEYIIFAINKQQLTAQAGTQAEAMKRKNTNWFFHGVPREKPFVPQRPALALNAAPQVLEIEDDVLANLEIPNGRQNENAGLVETPPPAPVVTEEEDGDTMDVDTFVPPPRPGSPKRPVVEELEEPEEEEKPRKKKKGKK